MHICIHVYVYIYIYICIHIHTYIHTYISNSWTCRMLVRKTAAGNISATAYKRNVHLCVGNFTNEGSDICLRSCWTDSSSGQIRFVVHVLRFKRMFTLPVSSVMFQKSVSKSTPNFLLLLFIILLVALSSIIYYSYH